MLYCNYLNRGNYPYIAIIVSLTLNDTNHVIEEGSRPALNQVAGNHVLFRPLRGEASDEGWIFVCLSQSCPFRVYILAIFFIYAMIYHLSRS